MCQWWYTAGGCGCVGGGGGGGGRGGEHANCLTTCLDYKTRGQLLIKGLL